MTDWHLVCITRLGKVSILKNLDYGLAVEAYRRLLPDQWPKDYKLPSCKKCSGYGYSYGGRNYGPTDDWLEKVEAIGPEGEQFRPWDGVEPKIIDYTHFCHCPKPMPPVPLVPATSFEERAMREAGSLA